MRLAIIFVLLFSKSLSFSQNHKGTTPARFGSYHSSIGVIGGLNQGNKFFPEIGVGYGVLEDLHGYTFRGVYASVEMNPWLNIYGAKLGAWMSTPILPISLGFSTAGYFEHGVHDQTVRPGIGFAYKYLHLTFEYNITLGKAEIDRKNRAQLSLKYHLPVWTIKKTAWFLERAPIDSQ